MALEFPSSLINKIQIQLRSAAGIPSYDADGPSVNTPSLDEAISGFDPSPPYLRCNQCYGRLLRGIQSMICVYCGSVQRRDGPLPSVSFNSTVGFRKLLESLEVDGSEPVVLDNGASDSSGGPSASRNGLVLSDLLDIKLRWPECSDKAQTSILSKAPNASGHSLNLAGVDLDNFFSSERTELASDVVEEHSIPNEKIKTTGNHVSSDHESLSMFQNINSSNMAVNSEDNTGGSSGDSFSPWEAAFQSASTETLPVDSKSAADPFVGSSSIDVTRPVEAVTDALELGIDIKFETSVHGNVGEFESNQDQLPSTTDDWGQDEIWVTGVSEVSNKTEPLEISSKAGKAELKNNLNNLSSVSDDRIKDDLWKSGIPQATTNAQIITNFGSQGNFGEFKNNQDQLPSTTVDDDWGQDDIWVTGNSQVSDNAEPFGVNTQKANETSNQGNPDQLLPTTSDDWGQDDIWVTGDLVASNKAVPFEINDQKTNEKGYQGNQDQLQSMTSDDWGQDDVWVTGNSRVLNNTEPFEISSKILEPELENNLNNISSVSGDWIQDDLWKSRSTGEMSNKTSNQGNVGEFTNSPDQLPSMTDDWGQDDVWGAVIPELSNKTEPSGMSSKADNRELKNDLNNISSVTGDWIQDDLWRTSSTLVAMNAEKSNEDPDSFDIWQDFTCSEKAETDPFVGSWPQTGSSNTVTNGNGKAIDSMGVTDEMKEKDLSDFLQQEIFSGVLGIQKSSSDVNSMQFETLTSDRVARKDVMSGADIGVLKEVENGKNFTAATSSTDPNVELLISQLPDLSFMLESDLSIPSKSKAPNSIL